MAIRGSVGPEQAVALLNKILAVDKPAIEKLLKLKVSVSKALNESEDPNLADLKMQEAGLKTVVNGKTIWSDGPHYYLGILGLLNGLFGSFEDGTLKGFGCIASVHDDKTGELKEFTLLQNQQILEPATTPPPVVTPPLVAVNADGSIPKDAGLQTPPIPVTSDPAKPVEGEGVQVN
jgi:hypothetical protein